MQEKYKEKFNCTDLSVAFNQTCLKEGLLPKYTILYIQYKIGEFESKVWFFSILTPYTTPKRNKQTESYF